MYARVVSLVTLLALLGQLAWRSDAATPTPLPEVVLYEHDRLTVHVTEMPLDRLLAAIAAATHAIVRGEVTARPISIDFTAVPFADGLARIFGAESFMLTYGSDGALRAIDMLNPGPAVAPPLGTKSSPGAPLAAEEAQAQILQRPVTITGALARALHTERPPIGGVLHAILQARRASVRGAARDVALAAFRRDPEIEAAYLSTLAPVEDDVLAGILRGAAHEGAVEEWMKALASH